MNLSAIQAVPPQFPVRVILENTSELTSTGWFEWIMNIATLVIALFGLIMSIIVYYKQKKDAEALNDSSRKLELFKTLVLDDNISQFHEIFKSLKQATDRLKELDYDQNHRDEAESAVQSNLRALNEEILSLFRAISNDLYNNLLIESDKCRDNIIESLADDTIKLHVLDNYKENILSHINNARESMIRLIYEYKG